jgi:hypothetical protein
MSVLEECHLLGCGAIRVLLEPTFEGTYHLHHQGGKNSKDEGDTFLQNVGSDTHMVPHPRRWHSS